MKRILIILLGMLLTALAPNQSLAEDNLLSVNTGIFMPGKNYGDAYDSLGGSLGFSFIRVNEYTGLEVGLTSYHIGGSPNDTTALGLDVLVHFQKRDFDGFQPFIALGMNIMSTDYGYSGGTLSDMGTGLVLKAGARYFFELKRNKYSYEKDRYFVGAYLKYFSNVILDDRTYETEDLDVGGRCICLEAGIWTD